MVEIALFAMFGGIMYASKVAMAALPNIHLIGMFIMVFTLVYRFKALIPIYLYIFLEGLFGGFGMWWYSYLYAWAVLWGITMLLPKNMPKKVAAFVYPAVCSLHGLIFGALCAILQAPLVGLPGIKGIITYTITGFPYDVIHAAGNLAFGTLVLPLSQILKKIKR